MTELVMARARLRRDVPAVAFAALLVPEDADQQTGASHRLLWSLYADGDPHRPRDFLWRQTRTGEFLTLGPRAPVDKHNLFELDHKPFAPELRPDQRLAFSLRANPTMRDQRGRRCDVVMNALHSLPPGERAAQRAQLTDEAVAGWLQRQGDRAGFDLAPGTLCIESYQQMRIPRPGGQRTIQFAVVDCTGELIVRDPATFVPALAAGFGRSRAFGCGMMLIWRVS